MKAINSQAFGFAKKIIGLDSNNRPKEILNAYVENNWLVLQLATCRFRIPN